MRPRVLITPREPFATSPPYRAAQAPDDFPFLERFQHASRKVREDFAFANLVLDLNDLRRDWGPSALNVTSQSSMSVKTQSILFFPA
jgi:hypothetical protein